MNTIKHTPAPWRIEQEPDLIAIKAFRLDNASDICALPDGKIDQANARLIAAAPELLDAVSDILGQLEAVGLLIDGEDCGQWHGAEGLSFAKAREAIAKATSEPVMAA
jgi:hypothetical protein